MNYATPADAQQPNPEQSADDLITDVLVVGAGPTGLMLANWLARVGVGVVVVDGKAGPTRESRALVVQARSMEIYDQLGIAAEVLEQTVPVRSIAPGFGTRVFGRIPIGEIGAGATPYSSLFVLEQSRNEQILYDNLCRLGGDVLWGHALERLDLERHALERLDLERLGLERLDLERLEPDAVDMDSGTGGDLFWRVTASQRWCRGRRPPRPCAPGTASEPTAPTRRCAGSPASRSRVPRMSTSSTSAMPSA